MLLERNRIRDELSRVRSQYEEEFCRLRKELDESSISLSNISKSKGNEVQLLVERHNVERDNLEREFRVNKYEFNVTVDEAAGH